MGILVLITLVGALIWTSKPPRRHPSRAHKQPAAEHSFKQKPRLQAKKRHQKGLGLLKQMQQPARMKRRKQLPPRERAPGVYDIVLIVIDTLRADATELHGAPVETTPFLRLLSEQGITFTNAFAPGPWTVPSMYSLMTGLYPSEHGIVSGGAAGIRSKQRTRGQQVLPPKAITLAERMKKAGYTTLGITTNFHLAPRFGFAQGFDAFAGEDFAFLPFPNLAVEAIADIFRAAPKSFLWLHYFDPHFPYLQVQPWFEQWNESKYRTYIDISTDVVLTYYRKKLKLQPDDPVAPEHLDLVVDGANYLTLNPDRLFYGLPYANQSVTEDHLGFYRASYFSNIRQTDEAMRAAFDKLGINDQTLVIVTSDHGEELMDHGGIGHRQSASVYQELLHVPLIIRLPDSERAGSKVDTPVSLIDIIPTLLDYLGQPLPKDLSGVSLMPLIQGAKIPNRPLFAEVKLRRGEGRALVEYPFKFIYNFTEQKGELYNLEEDPAEKKNLLTESPERAEAMHQRLIDWVEGKKPRWKIKNPDPIGPGDALKLKRMGYFE